MYYVMRFKRTLKSSCYIQWAGLAQRQGVKLVSGRTSVRYRFGSPFSSKRLWFVDTVLWLCPSLPTETLTWLSLLTILMQKSLWWWQCTDRYIISLSPHFHTPFPPFSPSLINLMVSVDVKHHVYLLTLVAIYVLTLWYFFKIKQTRSRLLNCVGSSREYPQNQCD